MAVVRRSWLARYGVAAGMALLAVVVRLQLIHHFGGRFPFITFFPAVMVAAWFGGFGPAVLSTIVLGVYAWLDPANAFESGHPGNIVALAIFGGSGVMLGALNESLLRGRAREEQARAEAEQARQEALRLASESQEDLARMQQVSTRLLQAGEFQLLLNDILDAAIEITDASMGDIQLLEEDGLRIVAHHGLNAAFLDFFNAADGRRAACGRAVERAERVVVEDVATSAIFAGTPALQVVLAAGVAALQSTPLVSRSGRILGVFSTHYRHAPQRPNERALHLLDILARQAADLIERTHVEGARALLAGIVESSDDAIVSQNQNGIVTSWNAAAERMYGYAAREVIGRSITLIIPPDRQHEGAAVFDRLKQGAHVAHLETERVAKDGRRFAISLTLSAVHDVRGNIVGVSGIARDITDRLREEKERARLLASEHAAREHAETASRAKDEFLATVSHELRTPLNAILGWAAMLEQTAAPDVRTAKGLQSIGRNTRTLVHLVDDVLDASRIINGKMRIEMAPMDLREAIDAAVEAVRPAAAAKDIDLHVETDPSARLLTGDATRLQQVVWNLLSNAVKFTPPGGRVDVSTERRDGTIELTVKDTGIGIAASFLPYVFDRFRQADASPTRAHGGLGLGLAIVRLLIELHGGTTHVESDGLGAGATFVVRLPVKAAPLRLAGERLLAMPLTEPPTISVPINGVRVLVVDDDRESCEMMVEALGRYGATVRVTMSAAAAMEVLPDFGPDVVLSDIAMPDQDGYALLETIRGFEGAFGRRVPVAAVTACARAEDRERALAAGFDEYVTKPVDPTALAYMVAMLAVGPTRSHGANTISGAGSD